jgi:hypothetical protein
MIGKASEVKVEEVELGNYEEWVLANPDVMVIDIKYAFHPDGFAWFLIIYKEAQS